MRIVWLVAMASVCVGAAGAARQQTTPSAAAPAQTPAVGDSTITLENDLKSQFAIVKSNVTRLAEAMPASEYSFTPVADVRPFVGSLMHIAATNLAMCRNLLQKPVPRDVPSLSKITDKTEAVAALAESFAFCDDYVRTLGPAMLSDTYPVTRIGQNGTRMEGRASKVGLLARLISHTNEMHGYVAMYARLKGVVPPASVPRVPAKTERRD